MPAPRSTSSGANCARPWAYLAVALAVMVAAPVLWSEPLRASYRLTLQRYLAKVAPPRLTFVGDSLTAHGDWGWRLERNPLGAANLAEGGVTVAQASLQAARAKSYRSPWVIVGVGTNDVVLHGRTPAQITDDYRFLLDQTPRTARVVVTLIPYTSFSQHEASITRANIGIAALARSRGAELIDLNPMVASEGLLRPKFTSDGVHLNNAGYAIWAAEVRRLTRLGPSQAGQSPRQLV